MAKLDAILYIDKIFLFQTTEKAISLQSDQPLFGSKSINLETQKKILSGPKSYTAYYYILVVQQVTVNLI
jgi:hypothetical protein